MTGTVYKSTGSWYKVKCFSGTFFECRIKGKFRIKGIKSTNPISVGDIVEFDLEKSNHRKTGVITNIYPRKNYIVRKSVNLSKQTHIIASNIDQVFLLVTVDNPPTSTSFIDRFLVTAEAYDIKAILLFNKEDLLNEVYTKVVDDLIRIYSNIGYECLKISAKNGNNLSTVKAEMKGNTSMFSGHSGVGKSTLINSIESKLNLKTKVISEMHQQGQHTTTFAEMFDLSFGARIIDTPGIKGFGIVDMASEELDQYFPELFAVKTDCKFHNCQHLNEPKCAVEAAVIKGQIAPSRYNSYLQIMKDENVNYRTDSYDSK